MVRPAAFLTLTLTLALLVAATVAPPAAFAQAGDPLLADLDMTGDGPAGGPGGGEFAQARKEMQEQRKAEQEKMKAQREEIKKSRQEIRKLVQEYRAADEAARPAVKERLHAALKAVQAKVAAGLKERLELMKRRQAKLEEQIRKVEAEGDAMVEARLEKICAGADRRGKGAKGEKGGK